MKLVSEGMLEKVKHSFRLSPKRVASIGAGADEKARAKEEAASNGSARKGGSSLLRQQVVFCY